MNENDSHARPFVSLSIGPPLWYRLKTSQQLLDGLPQTLNIHCHHRVNPSDFGEPLTSTLTAI